MYVRLNLQDRVPANPGRITLTPVDGQANTYDMALADNPRQAGDKVNAAVFEHIEDKISSLDVPGCVYSYKNIGGAL